MHDNHRQPPVSMTPFFVGQCLYYAHGNVSIVKNAVHITAVYAGFFAAFFHALHPVGSAICQLYRWRLMFPGGNRCLSHMNLIAGKFQSGKCGKIPVTFSNFPRVCVRIFSGIRVVSVSISSIPRRGSAPSRLMRSTAIVSGS